LPTWFIHRTPDAASAPAVVAVVARPELPS
jgi:hypothetical protein